jgi:cAMP phosphodiesterase
LGEVGISPDETGNEADANAVSSVTGGPCGYRMVSMDVSSEEYEDESLSSSGKKSHRWVFFESKSNSRSSMVGWLAEALG